MDTRFFSFTVLGVSGPPSYFGGRPLVRLLEAEGLESEAEAEPL